MCRGVEGWIYLCQWILFNSNLNVGSYLRQNYFSVSSSSIVSWNWHHFRKKSCLIFNQLRTYHGENMKPTSGMPIYTFFKINRAHGELPMGVFWVAFHHVLGEMWQSIWEAGESSLCKIFWGTLRCIHFTDSPPLYPRWRFCLNGTRICSISDFQIMIRKFFFSMSIFWIFCLSVAALPFCNITYKGPTLSW